MDLLLEKCHALFNENENRFRSVKVGSLIGSLITAVGENSGKFEYIYLSYALSAMSHKRFSDHSNLADQ